MTQVKLFMPNIFQHFLTRMVLQLLREKQCSTTLQLSTATTTIEMGATVQQTS